MFTYGQEFYETQMGGAVGSASVMVPNVPGILPALSVRGGGCGVGIWPGVVARCGISGLPGFDEDAIDRTALEIPASQLRAV
jgi:hypothetical protein